jgi:hypothetical protein
MSSSIVKSHDHTLEIKFQPDPPIEFTSIGNVHVFDATAMGFFSEGGVGLLKLTGYSDEICIENPAGDFNVGADENQIFIQNVPNGVLPEENLVPLRLRIQGHSNSEMNGYFDIQLVSKATSVVNPSNFDYTYTIPEDFSTNIALELCSIVIANTEYDTEEYDFTREYQWSQDDINWTDYEDLNLLNTQEPEYEENCQEGCPSCEVYPIDPDKPFYIRVLYTRTGTEPGGTMTVKNITINGEYEVKIQRLGELGTLQYADECLELVQTDIYKVFSMTGYTIDSNPENIEDIATIRFQISQDNCRTWSDWCMLTQENIQNFQVDPLRFFHIKYSICLPADYDENNGPIKIYDIILDGSFQNVSVDYVNGGKLGLRPEVANRPAQQGITLENGGANYCENIFGESISSTPLGSNNGSMHIAEADPNSAWNPYATQAASDLYNNLSNIVSNTFGFSVTYFPVNPDVKGIDRVFHEYQLLNVDQCGDVKVLVPENQFPDNQIKFTAFNLELFETFEIHITKEAFKSVFGIEKRPMKRDFLFFPEINRMYEVEHAQANRDFLNTSTYYRVTLKKYNKKANVKMSDTVENAVDSLTKNTTLDDLFGIEKAKEDKITNKEQYKPLSNDIIRLEVDKNAIIYEENLYNASLIVSKTHYDFSEMDVGETAVTYTRADLQLGKGDNRAFQCWFNFSALDHADVSEYVFLDNYDATNSLGYKAWYDDKKVYFMLNGNIYELPVLTIEQDIWYCLLINLNQCDEKLDIHVFRRFTTLDQDGFETDGTELASSRLNELWHEQFDIEPTEFTIEDLNATIPASFMRMTNIRLFNDKVETKSFTKVLNQYIIKKSNFLIFADNANEQIMTRSHA